MVKIIVIKQELLHKLLEHYPDPITIVGTDKNNYLLKEKKGLIFALDLYQISWQYCNA